ncbi:MULTISPECIES: sigma-54 dependent transcriptional regulator [Roseivirga]|jgi:DNA-binding NtrC family response regulator|uniref:Regulator n=1 Tax=Roseivirga spongicola TaxID=333140 RepID=A0A150X3V5_9BACT|nr:MULTISPECIES: sigma-54 dependent transcriptional regulator [Roseivirga]PWL28645.1 MAG: sigma-54-dependent Fis family transcriptional regulator [Roseivirga sp. XM-24bin3]KYG73394.1 regulator [Roseivirga spongicola]MBO6497107.1 sigma-54-dependent Fis family transcriptional regulator [Roseivirga sp.]MBO6659647.1 sigma-54-dependent Fis family transcriptional regulator [Roseivirga sp.]MBO6760525.1 sigma-54-dependent Fis family transcriptional regulator [Roseivirga sp.]
MNYVPESVRIFVVEDDPLYMKLVRYIAELNPDHIVHSFENGKSCLENLHENPKIVILDYSLPDMTGKDILMEIKKYNPDIQVIVVSSQESINTAVSLLKHGAYDYITKDNETKDRLLNAINNAKRFDSLTSEINALKEELNQKYEFDNSIIGESPAIQRVFKMMQKAVKTNITVSITGETGTGKEVVAKAIHHNSDKKSKPFVAVNIAAIPENLIESELFGHEKGAFTGAIARRKGKFEEANQGTLFLDEIGEMDINLQAKLLRVLQERELTRIGGNEVVKFDVRVIVATHRNLAEEVKAGNFREDLYYRLLGIPIELPPLRDRGQDVILIAKHLLGNFAKENKLGNIKLSKEAQNKLISYPFPGNVRELKSVIELAAVMCEDKLIEVEDITFNSLQKEGQFLFEEMTLRDYTFKIIRHFLDKYDNNVLLVAKKLDIGKSSIYRYLKEMEGEE